MAEITGNADKILVEETDFESPTSEALLQKIGANINYFIDNLGFQNSSTFTSSSNFNVPEATTQALIFAYGGGGGGGGNATGGSRDGQGGTGGSTLWADPTNGTLTFRGAHGGGPAAITGPETVRRTSPAAIQGHGGFSNGGAFGGFGADNAGQLFAANGAHYEGFSGGAGGSGIGTSAGGGGGAGAGGNGAAGANGGAASAGSSAAANTGAGGGGASSLTAYGAGGGAGAPLFVMLVDVTALDVIPVTIGAGGAGGFPTLGAGAVAGGAGGSGKLTVWY